MKKTGLVHTLKFLYKDHTLVRIRMNEALSKEPLVGRTLDVGGGHKPDYFNYFKRTPGSTVEMIDGSIVDVDFEKDRLPYSDGSMDTLIFCNVLEHIYNYRHILGELRRILKPKGQMIGFVPFWVNYHPDPRDFWRFTKESLYKVLSEAGFKEVTIVPMEGGPFLANFNTIVLSIPLRFLRPMVFPFYKALDFLFCKMRPKSKDRCPLGFLFLCK